MGLVGIASEGKGKKDCEEFREVYPGTSQTQNLS